MEALIRALRNRDIPLNEDDVAWAFEGTQTRRDASKWVQQYLRPSTLLTKDELEFYEKRGIEVPNCEDAPGRPLSDAEIEAAITSLENSTSAIEKQCQILESQKRALREIQTRNASSSQASTDAKGSRQKKFAREKAQLDFDIDDLVQATIGRLRSSIKQTDVATTGIPSQIDRILEKDDRLLDGLQKLLPKLSESMTDGEDATQVEQLCSTLNKLFVKEIRARLDRVYQENTGVGDDLANGSSEDLSGQQKKQRDNLRAELEELGGEVDGLVAIVVDHQYRKPLKQGAISSRADSQLQKAKWTEYTVSALVYLTSRLDALNDHVQHMHALGAALRAISSTLDDTLTEPDVKSGAIDRTGSPTIERTTSKGLKPLRLVQANLSEGQDPAMQFFRQHEIRVSDSDNTSRLAEMLQSTLRDRRERLAKLDKNTELSMTEGTGRSLAKVYQDSEDVLSAVYAQSKYSETQLVDGTLQSALDVLENSTQRLGDEMRELDVDAVAKALAAKQAEVVRKLTT
ncbi:Hypothetical predicted protein [Lecanosticta acicola]|uniref:Uncharacterized protein n=1 Tax=Lecanosticta acicola TaxID=111012 RepID=A0AAI8Z6A4_9PEZI|nr:Hypothetical predicted protein [Lecanosticta acicola]